MLSQEHSISQSDTGLIHSLESFGTVDGPGIRYVVFFQGCPMRCKYCHNPDTQSVHGGKRMSADEILKKAYDVREFLRGGGITATGGEPLLQLQFLTRLFKKAKTDYGFHTCLDTSGICFTESKKTEYAELLKYTDLVMLDIKHIDPDAHIDLTGQNIDNVLKFAQFLSESNIPIWIRHVLVPNITQNDEFLYRLGEFVGSLKTLKAVDVLPYHDMGKAKYKAMGLFYPLPDTPIPTKDDVIMARSIILDGIKKTLKEND